KEIRGGEHHAGRDITFKEQEERRIDPIGLLAFERRERALERRDAIVQVRGTTHGSPRNVRTRTSRSRNHARRRRRGSVAPCRAQSRRSSSCGGRSCSVFPTAQGPSRSSVAISGERASVEASGRRGFIG